ncbi:MAG: hypothetical protein COU32_00115 [Candidatus Magasanikbacteria bacterium CG10_big_fil_rev_8_21_14_0_10_42_10]|uniref:Fibronectin type-III domain-containing protein n=1 Tax=Candidatus Magasanikbacteria bacterium CG10_big_fil_rev_8_21_14_0_10_42_10 TaxID=1974649 RepID=A0A2H0TXC6_9BACT|nr:MAG: hypothetical protein COU32_00115 [Candidatus Magasanikbacteria bacterium CG10_big_fil_rev_8_21_14_0_10_42_10]
MHTIFSFFKKQEERFWMTVAILGIAMLAVLLPQLYDAHLGVVEAGDGSQGTPWTVCASGCDFTTLTSAFASSSVLTGNFVTVNATYASSTETFPLNFAGKGVTVDCALSGATIGTDSGGQVDILMASSSVLQQCNLSNTRLYLSDVSTATVSGNTFATSTTGTIFFASNGSGNSITNNTGINNIIAGSGQQNLTVMSNTIETYHATVNASSFFIENGENIIITSNTIHSYENTNTHLIFASSTDNVSIQQNVVKYDVPPVPQQIYGISVYDAPSSTIAYNTILLPSIEGTDYQWGWGVYVNRSTTSTAIVAEVNHNTVWIYARLHSGITVADSAVTTAGLSLTAQYNIFYNASSTNSLLGYGVKVYKDNASSTYSLNNDYNGYYHIETRVFDSNLDDTFTPTVGSNARIDNPYFKLGDVSTGNDTELAPYSLYVDVNGTEDIGSYSAVRGSNFSVDDTGTIDYATCDATSTSIIANAAADGDTWTLAAGTYTQITLATSSRFTGDITISGAGASTILLPSTPASAIQLTNLSGATVQNLIVQQASTTANFYAMPGMSFDYNGDSYDNTTDIGYPGNGYTLLIDTDCTDPQTTLVPFTTNDVTSFAGMGTDDYHLALVNYAQGGKSLGPGIPIYVTMLVPSSVATNQVSFESLANCPTPDVWIDSAFAVSGGSYTYASTTISNAGLTITSGYTDPPSIAKSTYGMAGVRLNNSTYTTISNVTSTGNYYGISFSGNSEANMLVDSTVTSSVIYDIFSSSTLDNTLSNVSFLNTSSSISDVGNVYVKFKSRAYVQNSVAAPLGGVVVEYTPYDIRSMTSGLYAAPSVTSDITGYTPYTSALDAYLMTSSSVVTTNGGYNPYVVVANVTSTYGETHIVDTVLDQQNEEFIITMYPPPTAPTNFATTFVSTSSVAFGWTDNSGDEDNFYIQHSIGFFPAYGTSVPANTTTGTVTGLTPNTMYEFRLTAQISGSHSTYDSVYSVYTLADVPGTVTVTANGTGILVVSWGTNSNPDTTEYYVLDTTTGHTSSWATSTSRSFSGFGAGTTNDFAVIARNGDGIETTTSTGSGTTAGSSGGGNNSTGTTLSPPPPLPPPTTTPETATTTAPGVPNFVMSINGGKGYAKSRTVVVTLNNALFEQYILSSSTNFSGLSFQPIVANTSYLLSAGDGKKTIYGKFQKTVNGVASTVTVSSTIFLDMTPPPKPVVGKTDTGVKNGKLVGKPTFAGTAEPGSVIRLQLSTGGTASIGVFEKQTVLPSKNDLMIAGLARYRQPDPFTWMRVAGFVGEYTTTTDALGNWQITLPVTPVPGDYTASLTTTDPAGNVSISPLQVAFVVPDIYGCTLSSAFNYDLQATVDDGSCIAVVNGCTDNTAYNFNASANTDNGSCVYTPPLPPQPELPVDQPPPPQTDTTDQTATTDTNNTTGGAGETDANTSAPNNAGANTSNGSATGGSDTGSGGSGSSSGAVQSIGTGIAQTTLAFAEKTQQSIQTSVSTTVAFVQKLISAPVNAIAHVIPEPVKKATRQAVKTVQEVADNPQVEKANEQVVAPTTVVVGATNVAVGFNLPQIFIFLRYLFTQPILLLRRRKQKQWGVIYNAYTKQPIDLAILRVFDEKTGRIITSQVTDAKGRYFIILVPGVYHIEIDHDGYKRDSELLRGRDHDVSFDHLYHPGQKITVTDTNVELNFNIPLDPNQDDVSTKTIVREYTKNAVQYSVSMVGFGVSLVSFFVSPVPYIGALLGLHIFFLIIFSFFRKHKKTTKVGVVRDALNRHRIGRVAVRIFDEKYNKLIETAVTDRKGRYGALVGSSTYYVTYEKVGYQKKKSPSLDFSIKKTNDTGGIIARDEVLHPVGGSLDKVSALEQNDQAISHNSSHPDPTRTLVKDGEISEDAGDTLRDIAQFGKEDVS